MNNPGLALAFQQNIC